MVSIMLMNNLQHMHFNGLLIQEPSGYPTVVLIFLGIHVYMDFMYQMLMLSVRHIDL